MVFLMRNKKIELKNCLVLLMGLAGMFGSALISGFYNNTLFSLGAILLLFSLTAMILRVVIHNQFDQTAILQDGVK